jgi:hypothetical protein
MRIPRSLLLDAVARLLQLLADRNLHLIEDVEDLMLVDAHLVGEMDPAGVVPATSRSVLTAGPAPAAS